MESSLVELIFVEMCAAICVGQFIAVLPAIPIAVYDDMIFFWENDILVDDFLQLLPKYFKKVCLNISMHRHAGKLYMS